MKKFIWLIISLINAGAMAFYINSMPDGKIPVHYGLDMQPDRYGSKWEMIIIAFVPAILSLLFIFYRQKTQNNENVKKNERVENIVIPTILVMFILLMWVFLLTLPGKFEMVRFIPTIVSSVLGLVMVIMSNYMSKTKQNRYLGIKTYSTLHNETVWRKTHRLCGKTGMIGGALMIVSGIAALFFNGITQMVITLACLFAAICLFGVIPSIYAAKLYRKLGPDKAEKADKAENAENAE